MPNRLKERLRLEGSQTVTNCHQLKLQAEDGKMRLTDVTGNARHELEKLTGKKVVSPNNFLLPGKEFKKIKK